MDNDNNNLVETTMDEAYIRHQLDTIVDKLGSLAEAFVKFQENTEGKIIRLEEKVLEIKNDQEHSKGSREKIFDRLEEHAKQNLNEFKLVEKRLDEIELTPAKKALETAEDNKKTFRREVVKWIVTGIIAIMVSLILAIGAKNIIQVFNDPIRIEEVQEE